MAQPKSIRSSTLDPLLNFKFIVSWAPADPSKGGNFEVVAGVNKVGQLSRTTQPIKFGEGGAPEYVHQVPGQTSYAAISLERGIILNPQFEQWANRVWGYDKTASSSGMQVVEYLRNLSIELMNQAGQVVSRYYVFNCWPSEYQPVPGLDASQGNTVAIETLKIENDGWARDASLEVPELPVINEPVSPSIAGVEVPKASSAEKEPSGGARGA